MLDKSALDLNLDGGHLLLRDVKGKPLVDVALKSGAASAQPGKPVALTLDGAIDQTPVVIRVSSGTLIDFLRVKEFVPFALSAEAAGAQLDLTGRVRLPISSRSGELRLLVKGERLDSMNALARVELPPWGPWSFGGSFRAAPSGYEVPDLEVRVGSSSLEGHGSLDVSGPRPRVDVSLTAPRVQLNDFEFGAWSPFEQKQAKPQKTMTVEEIGAKAKEGAARAQKLLSRETLLRADAYVDAAVEQVLSGEDKLGSGKLHAQLEDAKLEFGPATVNVPGGSATLKLTYEPTVTDVVVGAQIRVDRFDYGILARRIKPDTDLQGLFSLNLDIEGRAPTLDAVMAHANGRIDFAVWPKNMHAGIFDLWAVNLFVALAPAVDPAKESKVNCALGRFNLHDGHAGGGRGRRELQTGHPSLHPGTQGQGAAVLQPRDAGAGRRNLHRFPHRRCARRCRGNHRPSALLDHPRADREAHGGKHPAGRLRHLHECHTAGAQPLSRAEGQAPGAACARARCPPY
jgi:hypothetical protein